MRLSVLKTIGWVAEKLLQIQQSRDKCRKAESALFFPSCYLCPSAEENTERWTSSQIQGLHAWTQ